MFSIPDICVQEAARHLPFISGRKGIPVAYSLRVLEGVVEMLEVIDTAFYEVHQANARRRIAERDPDDWPILATALLLDCPIWTEDQDFFGTGVATWTTNNVGIYLNGD
jgi:predicted nucleic acid-binding protein